MCCSGRRSRSNVRYVNYNAGNRISGTPGQAAVLSAMPSLANAPPAILDDNMIMRWARIPKIARLIPVMNEVRILEQKIHANSCPTCGRKRDEIDRSVFETVKKILAEISDDICLQVKQAAGIVRYKVMYRNSSGQIQETTR